MKSGRQEREERVALVLLYYDVTLDSSTHFMDISYKLRGPLEISIEEEIVIFLTLISLFSILLQNELLILKNVSSFGR